MTANNQTYVYTYDISQFGLGKVYTASNGSATSQYFQNFTSLAPVTWTLNFQGMGLPSDLYSQYEQLMSNLTNQDAQCSSSNDGACQLPNSCDQYSYLDEYSFMVTFERANGNYLRVPLALFAQDLESGACRIAIINLSGEIEDSSNIVLGGMFFQNFFGIFEN